MENSLENSKKPTERNNIYKITYEEVPGKEEIEKKEEYKKTKDLSVEMISVQMLDILKDKISEYFKGPLSNPENTFHLKENCLLVENSSIYIGGSTTWSIDIEIFDGEEGKFFELYKEALQKKIKELGLDQNTLYALSYWRPAFEFLSKEEVDNSGNKKEVWFGDPLIIDRK